MRVSINGVPQNRWFMMDNPIKMDGLGVPLFQEIPRYVLNQILEMICVDENPI